MSTRSSRRWRSAPGFAFDSSQCSATRSGLCTIDDIAVYLVRRPIHGAVSGFASPERTCPMSTHHFHAIVWIDHREARVFHFSSTDVDRLVLRPEHPTKHIHHK